MTVSSGETDGQADNLRVLFWSASPGSISLKVVNQSGRIMSKITEIDGLPALPQQQQPIKDLEELGRRLMNPA